MANLEDTLRDIASRGELSHLSLAASQGGKMWRASFAMCSHFGVTFAEDKDPAQAIMLALTTAKLRKPRSTINLKPDHVETHDPVIVEEAPEDPLADLM
jgi:hypothetical protein